LFDVRVFHPNAPSYRQAQVVSLFRRHELEKKREYGDRTRGVDGESFTPLVFSTFGGLGKEATIFYNRLANLLSQKHNTSYHQTLSWVRCLLSFSLIATFCNTCHSWEQKVPAGSAFWYLLESTELCLVESQVSL